MPTTSNFGWTTPADTDLVKDGALAIRTLGNGIDTSFLDLKGGTTGQVLSKASNTDLDFSWVAQDDSNAIQNAIVDAKGDLISATAADTPARLAVGANGTVLTADSTEATGLKWAAPAGGGKVLQVVTAVKTDTFTSSTGNTYVDVTGLSAAITPANASNKVLVIVNIGALDASDVTVMGLQLVRGSTAIGIGDSAGSRWQTTAGIINAAANRSQSVTMINLDSPSTTSSTTYKVQLRGNVGGTSMYINRSATDTDNTTYWRAASTITLLEIGA